MVAAAGGPAGAPNQPTAWEVGLADPAPPITRHLNWRCCHQPPPLVPCIHPHHQRCCGLARQLHPLNPEAAIVHTPRSPKTSSAWSATRPCKPHATSTGVAAGTPPSPCIHPAPSSHHRPTRSHTTSCHTALRCQPPTANHTHLQKQQPSGRRESAPANQHMIISLAALPCPQSFRFHPLSESGALPSGAPVPAAASLDLGFQPHLSLFQTHALSPPAPTHSAHERRSTNTHT